jgi:2'-hydroxyisoflavone reductase
MKLLVLGGTGFVGRAIAELAVARGFEVTVASRGRTGERPAGVSWHELDRTEPAAIRPLAAISWDAVIDTWSDDPAAVESATSALSDSASWYGFVSSRSVYRWPLPPGSDESAAVVGLDDENPYAVRKRASELAVLEHFGGRSVLARAGLVLGPYEDVGRLTWWLQRAAAGGPMVAPEPADQVWQLIDARDLAAFMLDAAAARTNGTFNLVGSRSEGVTTQRLVEACVAATGHVATPIWIGPAVLARARVQSWDDLPGWVAPDTDFAGLHDCDVSAAVAAGLTCRPVEETVADTWAWMQTLPRRQRRPLKPGRPPAGLTAEKEQSIWWLTPPPIG